MSERSPRQNRVVVIGAGLSGLAAAHRISELSRGNEAVEVVVLEAKDRVGGAIWTERLDGFTLEGGADSFITNKPWGVELCRRIGLGDQLMGTEARHRRSFVVRDGRLLPVPEGFVLLTPNRIMPILTTPILSLRGKLRLLLDLIRPAKDVEGDESLASFVKRRLGREALDRLVQPLVGGIYTADPNELSLQATLPQFLRMEREHGSVIRAAIREARKVRSDRTASGARYGMFVTLADGMDTLPTTLAANLPPGALRLKSLVRRLSRCGESNRWVVDLLDGPSIQADAVILATEAHASARLLEGVDSQLALQLRSIPYASSAIVSVAYPRDRVGHPLDGFGAVVPAIEGRSILAISFLSVKFPNRAPAGTVLLRVFVGGATQPELFERDDEALKTIVRAELFDLLKARGEPLLIQVNRHGRAMPQYTLGHLDRVATARKLASRHSRLILTGNAFDGVGIPDVVHAGEMAGAAALQALAGPDAAVAA